MIFDKTQKDRVFHHFKSFSYLALGATGIYICILKIPVASSVSISIKWVSDQMPFLEYATRPDSVYPLLKLKEEYR